jgi:hypothetical protein
MNWPRVNRQHPCAICGKPDWCNFNERGSGCMRVESQVQMRNGGWWHPNNLSGGRREKTLSVESPSPTVAASGTATPAQTLDCEALLREWRWSQNGQLEPFAATLGVSITSLKALSCAYATEFKAFAFPMRDSSGKVIGIRLRTMDGKKFAVKGSKQGLFLTTEMAKQLLTA